MKPNVVLVGAAKAGTTSMYHYLIQHPEVYLPRERKEINYLGDVNQTVHSDEEYFNLYKAAGKQPVRMDISTSYLYAPHAAKNIKARLGADTKIIAILRNPIDASYSLWKQMRHYGTETLSFEDALALEEKRRATAEMRNRLQGWSGNYFYTDRYKFTPQLQRYYDLFPASQIKIFIYEELFSDLSSGWRELCEFLQISPGFRPDGFGNIHNPASSGYKSYLLHKLIYEKMPVKRAMAWMIPEKFKASLRLRLDDWNKKQDKTEMMPEKTYKKLQNLFADDIASLEKRLGKPLQRTWLQSTAKTITPDA